MGRKKRKLYGKISEQIDLDWLVHDVEGNVTKKRYLKDSIMYFLSLITYQNTTKQSEYKEGYRHLNDKILTNIMGNYRPSVVTKILQEKGVIEVITHIKGIRSKGYRLTEKYNTGEVKQILYGDRINSKLQDFYKKQDEEYKPYKKRYKYLDDQFRINQLTIKSEECKLFIYDFGKKLFHKSHVLPKQQRGFTLKSLFNYIGWLDSLVDDFNSNNGSGIVSLTNLRYNSKLTSLPKVIRPFILINCKPVGEVDISSSQPFILSTILTDKFTNDKTNGYNFHTIYPDYEEGMNNLKMVTPSNTRDNNNFILGVWLNDNQLDGIDLFTEFDFTQDFYSYILTEGKKLDPKLVDRICQKGNGRDVVKRNIMNYLFNRNDIQREGNKVIDLVSLIFPEVTNYVNRFNETYGNSEFSYLLQRTESYLMLSNVCKKLSVDSPEVPFFTIHDSILTTTDNLDLVKKTIIDTISTITGKTVSVKVKDLNGNSGLDENVVNDYFTNKLKITSKDKYDKKRTFILESNVQKGLEIMFPDIQERNIWYDTMNNEINEQMMICKTDTSHPPT